MILQKLEHTRSLAGRGMNIMTTVSGFLSPFTPKIKALYPILLLITLQGAFCSFLNFQYICERARSLTLQGVSAAICFWREWNELLVECLKGPLWITRGGGACALLWEPDGVTLGPSILKYMRNDLCGSSSSDDSSNMAVLGFGLCVNFVAFAFFVTWLPSSSLSLSSASCLLQCLFSHASRLLMSYFLQHVNVMFVGDVESERVLSLVLGSVLGGFMEMKIGSWWKVSTWHEPAQFITLFVTAP